MTPTTVTMVDMTHDAVQHVPDIYPYIGGYCSGLDSVPWDAADWSKYRSARVIRIYQGAGAFPGVAGFDEIDVESGAVTPQQAADLVQQRVNAGITWTGIYGSDAALAETSTLIQAKGHVIWNGHVYCRLADWNLNEVQATALVGTYVHGMTCVGVQWASPESNPHTVLPGTSLTLAQANADLSVVDANWIPSGGFSPPAPPPPPPPSTVLDAVLVMLPGGAVKHVSSTDTGKTWF